MYIHTHTQKKSTDLAWEYCFIWQPTGVFRLLLASANGEDTLGGACKAWPRVCSLELRI